jgi:hypothetical protein
MDAYDMSNIYLARDAPTKKRSYKKKVVSPEPARPDPPKPKQPTAKEMLAEMQKKVDYYKNMARQFDEKYAPLNTEDYYAVQYKGKSVKVPVGLTGHLKALFDKNE